MKSILVVSLIALTVIGSLQAREFRVEAKAGYYFLTNDTTKDIYCRGSGIYGAELTGQLFNGCCDGFDDCCDSCWSNIYGWMSVDYFQKKGHSIGGENGVVIQTPNTRNNETTTTDDSYKTKMTLVPLGFGLKYDSHWGGCDDCCWQGNWYLGAGVLAAYLKECNKSPYTIPERSKWGAGGVVKGGILVDLYCNWFIDLWADYMFIKIKFCDGTSKTGFIQGRKADVSGFGLGAGLGYRF